MPTTELCPLHFPHNTGPNDLLGFFLFVLLLRFWFYSCTEMTDFKPCIKTSLLFSEILWASGAARIKAKLTHTLQCTSRKTIGH